MKKSNLLTTAAAVMLLTAAPAAAQTCIKTPSCADLGYTKTAADCSGKTILKCPLDNTQVYCPGYEETLRTYKVGDTYVDANGIGVGTVVQVDATGKHGVIITSGGRASEEDAGKNCLLKTTAGFSWSLADGKSICKVASPFGGGTIPCSYITVEGKGACLSDGWTTLSSSSGNCKGITMFGYFCIASF